MKQGLEVLDRQREEVERLRKRWAESGDFSLLVRSPETIVRSLPARFAIHHAADQVEAACPHDQADEATWSAFIASAHLERLQTAVISFAALPDADIRAYGLRSRRSVAQFRLLILDMMCAVLLAAADRKYPSVRDRVFDLQMMLDPDEAKAAPRR